MLTQLWTSKLGNREYGSQGLSMQARVLGGEGKTTLPGAPALPSQQVRPLLEQAYSTPLTPCAIQGNWKKLSRSWRSGSSLDQQR